jgi:hypothetical protein
MDGIEIKIFVKKLYICQVINFSYFLISAFCAKKDYIIIFAGD